MEGKIFTTLGYLDEAEVVMQETVVEDTEWHTMIRRDKYLKSTGDWIGNDLHMNIKKMPPIYGEVSTL